MSKVTTSPSKAASKISSTSWSPAISRPVAGVPHARGPVFGQGEHVLAVGGEACPADGGVMRQDAHLLTR